MTKHKKSKKLSHKHKVCVECGLRKLVGTFGDCVWLSPTGERRTYKRHTCNDCRTQKRKSKVSLCHTDNHCTVVAVVITDIPPPVLATVLTDPLVTNTEGVEELMVPLYVREQLPPQDTLMDWATKTPTAQKHITLVGDAHHPGDTMTPQERWMWHNKPGRVAIGLGHTMSQIAKDEEAWTLERIEVYRKQQATKRLARQREIQGRYDEMRVLYQKLHNKRYPYSGLVLNYYFQLQHIVTGETYICGEPRLQHYLENYTPVTVADESVYDAPRYAHYDPPYFMTQPTVEDTEILEAAYALYEIEQYEEPIDALYTQNKLEL
jgi:hypothetical protein